MLRAIKNFLIVAGMAAGMIGISSLDSEDITIAVIMTLAGFGTVALLSMVDEESY